MALACSTLLRFKHIAYLGKYIMQPFACGALSAWDNDQIDHWKIDAFNQADVGGRTLAAETSFSTLFPKYREHYLREWWPQVTSSLKEHHVDCQLDLVEGSMTVRTTRKTWDPFIIIKVCTLVVGGGAVLCKSRFSDAKVAFTKAVGWHSPCNQPRYGRLPIFNFVCYTKTQRGGNVADAS